MKNIGNKVKQFKKIDLVNYSYILSLSATMMMIIIIIIIIMVIFKCYFSGELIALT